jgi:hypothetical protein
LPRAGDRRGSGLSNALPIGVLGHGSGALLGGVQAQSATSPSPAEAAGAPSVTAAGSSQAVPQVSTPVGRALGVAAYQVRDQEPPPVRFTGQTGIDSRVARFGPPTPKRATRLADASVDPT